MRMMNKRLLMLTCLHHLHHILRASSHAKTKNL